MLGGATCRDRRSHWSEGLEALEGSLLNVYNKNDNVLRLLYKLMELNEPRKPAENCGAVETNEEMGG